MHPERVFRVYVDETMLKPMPAFTYNLSITLAFALLAGCTAKTDTSAHLQQEPAGAAFYSANVKDSFYVQTQLPIEYSDSTARRYPVVIVLDANFHFPMLAASVRQYEKGGLLPPLILIGVGYRSFKAMDSLRVRDYLYPAATPSDELAAPGGGEPFRQFIRRELVPWIDSRYRTTTNDRSLLGHSLGGYFSLYTLLSQAKERTHEFRNFVAASPPIWYNDYYLNQLPSQLTAFGRGDSIYVFLSVGGEENPRWDIKPNRALADKLSRMSGLQVSGSCYNQLGHMDTGQLSFLKGLQAFYQ
ncbi:alpha/beta hydrolase [Fibrella sp. WM1]|uniref:alpha/beta hydrolase n=1 Tax=Fibrella musci TaxID=3242485 RepID=UPI0035204938